MAVTISEVARLAGVSPGTVSQVLNGREEARIASSTQARVREAAQALGYRPSRAARSLATGRHDLIVVETYSLSHSFAGEVAETLQALIHADGFDVVFINRREEAEKLHGVVDGYISVARSEEPTHLSGALPYVDLISRQQPSAECRWDRVILDLYQSSYDAVRHLCDQGVTDIAHMTSEPEERAPGMRLRGYLDALADCDLSPKIYRVPSDSERCAFDLVSELITRKRLPEAIFCRNDLLALGTYFAAQRGGVGVGGNLLVVGCNDLDLARLMTPALSSISMNVFEGCKAAWQLLLHRLDDPQRAFQSASIPSIFVPRSSSVVLPRNQR